jgi:hypothetical protein
LTREGLPVGLQIIGPEGEDPTTIEFARLLAAEIGGFVPRRHTPDPQYRTHRKLSGGQIRCERLAERPVSSEPVSGLEISLMAGKIQGISSISALAARNGGRKSH